MVVKKWVKDKVNKIPVVGDLVDIVPDAFNPLYGPLGIADSVLKSGQAVATAPKRAPIAVYNLGRGIAGNVVVFGKNVFFDAAANITVGYGDRTAIWENPVSSIWEWVEQDIVRDLVGLPASDGSVGSS